MSCKSIGHTPDGVPLRQDDAFSWVGWDDGILESPSNIAGRAYAKATREYNANLKEAKRKMKEEVQGLDRRLSVVEGRIDMTGVPEVREDSSIGEVKDAVSKMRKRIAGSALCAALALSLLAKTNEVHYANVNDLRDGKVVTNVVFGDSSASERDPVFSAWASSATNKQGVVTNIPHSVDKARAAVELYSTNMTQSKKTEFIGKLVEYIKEKEGIK